MEKHAARLGAGNVEIELDGEKVTLKPSLRVAQTISRNASGISGAMDAVNRFDFDMVVGVIALGLNISGREADALPAKVYETGMTNLVGPVSRFLAIVANGGREPSLTDGGEEGKNPRS
jgi:hypothetical protein